MSDAPEFNRLAGETSPYLLQHADNPVHWQPWDDQSLALAVALDRPILLSVGYSACHWCHVMAHESFADAATATVMNELFVNIKVDREERPDLDQIYQIAHQMLTQRPGGWPLTMFLTPRGQVPFFGGTYFPNTARHGLPGFAELLSRVAEFYRNNGDEIERQSDSIIEVYRQLNPAPDLDATLNSEPLQAARQALLAEFDPQYGGFGTAPKFPQPGNIDRLLRHWRHTVHDDKPDLQALFMASRSLQGMCQGGLFDQLGGGFYRYSVDSQWMIPHFEKMLYDNGLLLAVNADAARATGEPLFREAAVATGEWLLREMRAPGGGFCSSLDADSEGGEGRYYVWDRSEVRDALDDDAYRVFERHYGLDRDANFEGKWHLHAFVDRDTLASGLQLGRGEIDRRLARARQSLMALRARRVRPDRDEKILTSWNALAIRGLAIAGRQLGREDFIDGAVEAVDFVRDTLWQEGRLRATCKDGRARFAAYLDDHAFLIDALIEVLQSRWRSADLEFAVALADVMLEHFSDTADGGFFFTADDHETLLHRPKPLADDATPAGNGVAAQVLNRLGHVLGSQRYIAAAEGALRAAWEPLNRVPHAHAAMLCALDEFLDQPECIILRGSAASFAPWLETAHALYTPNRLCFAIPAGDTLPPALAEKKALGEVTAYLCRGRTCSMPMTDIGEFAQSLRGR